MTQKVDKQRISVSLPQEDIDTLKRLAEEQGITATAALRKAIATEAFIRREAVTQKGKVVIHKPNGTVEHVVFR
jgi:hypothetical protein